MKKMLVTFIAKPSQRHDVLELMSRILDFTDEDKEVVGLSNKTLLPPSPSRRYDSVDKKPLSQLWVDYLMQESGSPAPPSRQPPGTPQSAGSQRHLHDSRRSFVTSVPQYT